jgi:hypothetical protein
MHADEGPAVADPSLVARDRLGRDDLFDLGGGADPLAAVVAPA